MILKSQCRASVCIHKFLSSVMPHRLVTIPVKTYVLRKKQKQMPGAWQSSVGITTPKFPKRPMKGFKVLPNVCLWHFLGIKTLKINSQVTGVGVSLPIYLMKTKRFHFVGGVGNIRTSDVVSLVMFLTWRNMCPSWTGTRLQTCR